MSMMDLLETDAKKRESGGRNVVSTCHTQHGLQDTFKDPKLSIKSLKVFDQKSGYLIINFY